MIKKAIEYTGKEFFRIGSLTHFSKIFIHFSICIRRGTHVLKALARGATACSIGRPYLYGLAAGGQAGVSKALELLRAEVERGMGLIGCRNVSEIGEKHIV